MAAPEMRPMSIGDILDTTFRQYRTRFVPFLLITMMVYVPFGLVMAGIQTSLRFAQPGPFGQPGGQRVRVWMVALNQSPPPVVLAQAPGGQFDPNAPVGPPNLAALIPLMVGSLIFFLVLWPLCQGALVQNISAAYLGGELGAWESYSRALPRIFRMLITQFLAGIVIMLGCFLLIVPAIIFGLWFTLIVPVVMLEKHGITGTLGRSRELMRGNLGKAFRLGMVVAIMGMVVNYGWAFTSAAIPWPHPFLQHFLGTIVPAVILPIQIAPTILLYYDIRIRKEGFDLERLAAALGVGPALA